MALGGGSVVHSCWAVLTWPVGLDACCWCAAEREDGLLLTALAAAVGGGGGTMVLCAELPWGTAVCLPALLRADVICEGVHDRQ